MIGSHAFLDWLENTSDYLSPVVVKEVRQLTRGREFYYSFTTSLLIGLTVAFFGAADALSGNGTSGKWTFTALMSCLTLLGLVVVPIGAFSALRNERLEQTFELITVTALSPRRIVIGKLLAQAVKLATLFAGLAPFIAMTFLLGGIDFATILVSLLILFLWSLWACAVCLCLSSMIKTRAVSGLVMGAAGVLLFLMLVVFVLPRAIYFGRGGFVGAFFVGFGATGSQSWWVLAITTTVCLATMVNLVLLAENRLSLPSEDRVTALRVGFLLQFLLIAAWTLSFDGGSLAARSNAAQALGVLGGLHLAVVAMFTVTEDLVLSRRVRLRMDARHPGAACSRCSDPAPGAAPSMCWCRWPSSWRWVGGFGPRGRACGGSWRSAGTSVSSQACRQRPSASSDQRVPHRSTCGSLCWYCCLSPWCCRTSFSTCCGSPTSSI